VVLPAGRFRGLGDASPRNSRTTDSGALLRLAQVRAKARTLCDALNLAMGGREVGLGWVREGGAGDGCAVRGPRGYAVRRSVLAR
jgi:hypothetical protein